VQHQLNLLCPFSYKQEITLGVLLDPQLIQILVNTIPLINIECKLCNNVQIMANFINNYFTTLLPHMQFGTPSNVQAALNYFLKVFKNPFPSINMRR
jgi:hypothetical protein